MTKFDIGDPIYHSLIGMEGKISAVGVNSDPTQYYVSIPGFGVFFALEENLESLVTSETILTMLLEVRSIFDEMNVSESLRLELDRAIRQLERNLAYR